MVFFSDCFIDHFLFKEKKNHKCRFKVEIRPFNLAVNNFISGDYANFPLETLFRIKKEMTNNCSRNYL